jgi:hypothetical protein
VFCSDRCRKRAHRRRHAGLSEDAYQARFADLIPRLQGFTDGTQEKLREIVVSRLRPSRYSQTRHVLVDVHQDSLTARAGEPARADLEERAWTLSLSWDGTAAVACSSADETLGVELFMTDLLGPAVAAAAEAIKLTGGYGPAHLAIQVVSTLTLLPGLGVPRDLPLSVRMRRWFEGEPGDELLDSVRRELLRAAGYPEWEPE